MRLPSRFALMTLAAICLVPAQLRAGDWPQFRHDASRTAASPQALPAELELRWRRELPAPRPAFPCELRLAYDASYEPVVMGRTMFVPSMVTDSVTALDTETGNRRWRFFAEGPVRFAPVAWEDKIYFVSDDGYLYCLRADDGTLQWKFRGLPQDEPDRKVLGHGRLISMFAARGGPVLADGVIYFAAGLWPTEGVFVHAVDARSGQAVWSNTKVDLIPKSNWDHGVAGDSGLSPQGYLAVVGDRLVVPCGAQLPAFLDLKTGKLHEYTMGWGGRNGLPKGCWFVAGAGNYLSHGGDLYDVARPSTERFADTKPGQSDWKPLLYPGGFTRLETEPASQRELDDFAQPVITPEAIYSSCGGERVVARSLTDVAFEKIDPEKLPAPRAKDTYPDTLGGRLAQLWELPCELDVHIKAGSRLLVAGSRSAGEKINTTATEDPNSLHTIARVGNPAPGSGVIELIETAGNQPKVVWSAEIDGTPHRLLAADGKLFVVTAEGSILAFAAPQSGEAVAHGVSHGKHTPDDSWTKRAGAMLKATGVDDGYALVLGIDRGRLVEELLRQSDLHVIAIDADSDKVAALRRRLDEAGLYGTRAGALVGSLVNMNLPPYMANLVTTETPGALEQADAQALAEIVFHTLRPYGGVACAWGAVADRAGIEAIVDAGAFPSAQVSQSGEFVLLRRSGPLPGAADWSHAQANAACTGASQDDSVRAPMKVLWFDASLRWHKFRGQNQVRIAGGRLILLEEGLLRASDVYTGRKLWETEVPVGAKPLDSPIERERIRYQRHRSWGPPPHLAPTTEFVAVDDAIYVTQGTRCLVFEPNSGKPDGSIELPKGLDAPWSNLRVCGRYLVGSSGPHVLCFDRGERKLLWRTEASRAALSVAIGGDKVFCAELPNVRQGEDPVYDGTLLALKLASGERLWQRPGGARLRYSPDFDLVVTPINFYRAADGRPVLPENEAQQHRFVVQASGVSKPGLTGFVAGNRLLTGSEQVLQIYELPSAKPLGEPLRWVRRGCTATRASLHLLTTRYHGNSAWIDLATREITPLLGVRPACSVNNNLYPADGVLNVPNVTAGCTCNYMPVSAACVPAEAIEPGTGR